MFSITYSLGPGGGEGGGAVIWVQWMGGQHGYCCSRFHVQRLGEQETSTTHFFCIAGECHMDSLVEVEVGVLGWGWCMWTQGEGGGGGLVRARGEL